MKQTNFLFHQQRVDYLEEQFWELILEVTAIQIDETPLKVLDKVNKSTSYMFVIYAIIRGKPIIRYIYRPTQSADFLREKLKDCKGILHTDGYRSYDVLASEFPYICWVHARRGFSYILKVDKTHKGANAMVSLIKEIYKIEKRAVVNRIYAFMHNEILKTLPNSSYGWALAYLNNQWDKLRVFLDHPDLWPDTNLVENTIKPFDIGGKNWLFSGTAAVTHASAFFYSLIETAKAKKIEPYFYLKSLFDRVTLGEKPSLFDMG